MSKEQTEVNYSFLCSANVLKERADEIEKKSLEDLNFHKRRGEASSESVAYYERKVLEAKDTAKLLRGYVRDLMSRQRLEWAENPYKEQ